MSYGKPVSLLDFRGGYNLRTPYELLKVNELIKAENSQWRNGLEQRGGHRVYATGLAASDVIMGVSPRFYVNSAWTTIVAVDEHIGGDVRFWSLIGTTLARLSASVTFTAATTVIMAEHSGKIIAVNGTDDPLVIYYDSGWVLKTLDEYDLRTRNIIYWKAGQYTAIGESYADDTTDAQDTGAADFELSSGTINDGFFIACDHTFNKVVLVDVEQATGSPAVIYQVWDADNEVWANCSMVQTPTWTDAAGDRTIEFDYPVVMGRWSGSESFMANKFILRVQFITAPDAAFSCKSAVVYHSQWITQITSDNKPHFVISHGTRLWLAVGYLFFYSPPNDIVGWRGLSESEYFLEGGPSIRSAVSFKGVLVVLKDNAFYVFYGTELQSFLRKKLFDVGVEAILSPVATEDGEMVFLAPDGIRMFDGVRCVPCSKHIQTDLDAWTKSDAVAVRYQGEYWISFPTDDKVLTVDPSTLEIDEKTGDGHAAFYKFTGIPVDYWITCDGKGDTGYILAAVQAATPYIARMDNGTDDEFTASTDTAIDFQVQTNYISPGSYANHKSYGLFKARLKKATAVARYALTFYADDGARNQSATIVVPAGSDYYEREFPRVPHHVDGKNLSLLVRNNQAGDAGFRGLSFEYQKKRF